MAAVGLEVVDAVGDGHAYGVLAEVVVINGGGSLGPLGARVFEQPDHLPFLGVDADDRQPLAFESVAGAADGLELPIAICGAAGADRLLVDVKVEVELLEQAADRAGADADAHAAQLEADLRGSLATPFDAADRIPSGVVLHQPLDLRGDLGRFFSTGLRPPPGRRIPSASTLPSSNSRLPLAMV